MSDVSSRLGYGIPSDTSVVVNRTTKVCDVFGVNSTGASITGDTYTDGQIITCTFPAGTDYVDTRRSFLTFELFSTVVGNKKWMFGVHGSGCNFFKSIAIFARSGEELCRTEDFNLLKNMMLQFQYSRQWFQRQGAGMWYGSKVFNSPQTFIIPMYILSPLFSYGKLLPAALVSGMRIELTLEQHEKVTFGVLVDAEDVLPEPAMTYSIGKVQFHLEMVKLGDNIRMAMDEVLATKGIEMVYTGWHHTSLRSETGMKHTTSVSITDSYTRGLRAFARVRALESDEYKDQNRLPPEDERDSLRGEHIFPYQTYQWRHGDRYYPDKPVVSNGSRSIIKSLSYMLNAVNQFDGDREQSYATLLGDYSMSEITEELLSGNLNAGQDVAFTFWYPPFPGKLGCYARDAHVVGVDLTRDSDVKISGRPINNIEPLTFNFTCNPFSGEESDAGGGIAQVDVPRIVDVFLQYVKLVRVFLNSVQVEK